MQVEHDKIFMSGPKGDFHRGSVTIGLLGDLTVEINWAVNALSLHVPVNAHRSMIVQPHPNLDAARNLVIDLWRKGSAPTEHLFLWTSNEAIEWDAVARAMEANKPVVQIGKGPRASWCLRKDALSKMGPSGPWFKDGKWLGEGEVLDMSELRVASEQYTQQALPTQHKDATPEQQMVICVPSLGKTSLPWVGHALQMGGPVATVRYLALSINNEVAEARQQLVDATLAMNPRPAYMFFYGDDMLPSPNALLLLWETMRKHDLPAVGGLYAMKAHPPTRYLMWNDEEPGLFIPGKHFEIGDQVACDGTGLDFTLIKTDALAKIQAPHFKTGLEWVEGRGIMVHTEDAYFWKKYREATGFRPVVDTRARIGHYHNMDGGVY